jgi:hypothetical protein
MNVRLVFVPPGGGEADCTLDVDLPAVPRQGDYLTVLRDGGLESYVVRRLWWSVDGRGVDGALREVAAECAAAAGGWDGAEHRRRCERWRVNGLPVPALEASGY